MIFLTIMFLIGILGFIINRKNIALSVSSIETMLLAVTFLVLISSFGFDEAIGQTFGVHIIAIAGAMWVIRFRILGCFFFANPQNILIIMFNLVIATITLFLFIYEEPFFVLSTLLDKTLLVEFPEIDSTTLMALSPYFVTGFCDAESCFNVSVSKRIKSTVGYVVQARFVIELQLSDIDLLFKIQSFFKGIGTVTKDPVKNVCRFSVVSIKDINNLIIPHFTEYPLQSAKSVDFSIWAQIVKLLNDKKHLTLAGLQQIVSLKATLNFGLSENLKKEFPNLSVLERPNYSPDNTILNPDWISGFVEGGLFLLL
uniref:LAGLIDADG homing endonuclease n=1 Tax=Rhizoctonia solani TaxID=456999 RepID=A0A8E8L7P2_9AGAM|nr:LAGLIDADG homing endonuclease [Rhizoctonia solani]